jgi:ribonuclease VapC
MWITSVNLGEVWYKIARRSSELADRYVEHVKGLGIEVQEADWELTRGAAQFKARYPISYADCFAAALAKRHRAELVTGDPEFHRVEKEIRIHWLR